MRAFRLSVAVLLCLSLLPACELFRGGTKPTVPERQESGVEVESGTSWEVGDVILAGQPTAKGFEEAKKKGVAKVLNLRQPQEQADFDEEELVRSMSMDYANVPVDVGTLDDATLDQFLAELRGVDGPVLIHCGSGNRVAGLWAVHLHENLGVPADEAMELAKQNGLRSERLEQVVRKRIEAPAEEAASEGSESGDED